MARPVAYGQVFGGRTVVGIPAAASQPFQANSGKFVHLDSSRYAVISSNTNTADLVGWADCGTFSTSSTAGADIIPVNIDLSAVYEMPINASLAESTLKGLIGKVCDIVVTSNIQYADYDAATDNTLQIVGYKYYGSGTDEQSLLVRLYARNQSSTHVA